MRLVHKAHPSPGWDLWRSHFLVQETRQGEGSGLGIDPNNYTYSRLACVPVPLAMLLAGSPSTLRITLEGRHYHLCCKDENK